MVGVVKPALTYVGAPPNCEVQGGGRGQGRGASGGDQHVCWRQEAPGPHIQAGTHRDPLQPHPLHTDSAGRGTSMLFHSRSSRSPPARPHKLGTPFGAGCERSDSGAHVCLDTPSLWLPVFLRGARDYDGAWGSLAVGSGSGATWSPQAPALPLTHTLATGQDPHSW